MQSIEQSTDIGEDVIEMKEAGVTDTKPQPPGHSLVYGDLFGLKSTNKHINQTTFVKQHTWIKGPSQCLIYILKYILSVNQFIIHFVLGLINISRTTVDDLLCKGIEKLLRIAMYEPRLTLLITIIEQEIFGKKKMHDPSFTELLEQQRQAKKRLCKISTSLGAVADTIQSPALNKQLMYCLFDMIIAELYPELGLENKLQSKIKEND